MLQMVNGGGFFEKYTWYFANMLEKMIKRLIQLIRACCISLHKNIELNDIWNTRISNTARFGGVGKIHCQGAIELLNNAAVMSGTKQATLEIGQNVFINRNVIIACRKHIEIGAGTVIGPNVVIYDHDHRFDANGRVKESAPNPYKEGDVIVGKNVWLGAGAILLRGTNIGDNTIIAAGAIVKGKIPEGVLVRRENNNIIEKLENKCS